MHIATAAAETTANWFLDGGWVSILAMLISAGSVLVAWKARLDVGKYRDAAWRLDPVPTTDEYLRLQFKLVNIGETRAKNVKIVFDVDPTGHIVTVAGAPATGDHMWALIQPGESVLIDFAWSQGAGTASTALSWFDTHIASNTLRNGATVTWTNVLHARRKDRVVLPRFWSDWMIDTTQAEIAPKAEDGA